MSNENTHITDYRTYGKVAILLLILTTVTLLVTEFDLKAWNVAIALAIAVTKGTLIVLYFMHVKFESLLLKLLVAGVAILFALFIVLTFADYLFR